MSAKRTVITTTTPRKRPAQGMTPEEQHQEDRQRFLHLIGYYSDRPRWLNNVIAIAIVILAVIVLAANGFFSTSR